MHSSGVLCRRCSVKICIPASLEGRFGESFPLSDLHHGIAIKAVISKIAAAIDSRGPQVPFNAGGIVSATAGGRAIKTASASKPWATSFFAQVPDGGTVHIAATKSPPTEGVEALQRDKPLVNTHHDGFFDRTPAFPLRSCIAHECRYSA